MSAKVYIEGGGSSKLDRINCRRGFSELLANAGLRHRLPRLVACGGRDSAYDDFLTAHASSSAGELISLLVDSEDPVADIERTWNHLQQRDGWNRPTGARDEQVFLMTTCMETWIASDRAALRHRYGNNLQENALPPLDNIEARERGYVLDRLRQATRNCTSSYAKGEHSFKLLARLDPAVLVQWLPSFARMVRILLHEV